MLLQQKRLLAAVELCRTVGSRWIDCVALCFAATVVFVCRHSGALAADSGALVHAVARQRREVGGVVTALRRRDVRDVRYDVWGESLGGSSAGPSGDGVYCFVLLIRVQTRP